MDKVARPKKQRNILPSISAEEVELVLKAAEKPRNGGSSLPRKVEVQRDKTIVLLLFDSGLRLSELVDIKLEDVDFEHRRILVRNRKGGKQRFVKFTERT